MADMTEGLQAKVARIEQKLDALSESFDKRFDEVSDHFVEQREYTEFAFERLRTEVVERFTRVEAQMATKTDIARLERKLDQLIDDRVRRPSRPRARRLPKKR